MGIVSISSKLSKTVELLDVPPVLTKLRLKNWKEKSIKYKGHLKVTPSKMFW